MKTSRIGIVIVFFIATLSLNSQVIANSSKSTMRITCEKVDITNNDKRKGEIFVFELKEPVEMSASDLEDEFDYKFDIPLAFTLKRYQKTLEGVTDRESYIDQMLLGPTIDNEPLGGFGRSTAAFFSFEHSSNEHGRIQFEVLTSAGLDSANVSLNGAKYPNYYFHCEPPLFRDIKEEVSYGEPLDTGDRVNGESVN